MRYLDSLAALRGGWTRWVDRYSRSSCDGVGGYGDAYGGYGGGYGYGYGYGSPGGGGYGCYSYSYSSGSGSGDGNPGGGEHDLP